MVRFRLAYRRWVALFVLSVGLVLAAGCSSSDDNHSSLPAVRVGLLEFGTVHWEMDTVKRLKLGVKHGVHIRIVPLASQNALKVALQGHKVDLVVSDWIWVARQRAHHHDYQFVPYSKAVGAVMVDPAAGVHRLADLAGRKFGIAGGPVDKTWLLAQAYAHKSAGLNLAGAVEPTYAAPPMINHLLLAGKIPAAINFWHYDASASAQGMKPLLTVAQMLHVLGIDTVPPLLGWVFSQHWADSHRQALKAFIAATYDAKHVLATSDAAWQSLRSEIKPANDAVFAAIKAGYRAGIVKHYGAPQIAAAGQLFHIIARQSNGKLTGGARRLSPDVFWDGFRLP